MTKPKRRPKRRDITYGEAVALFSLLPDRVLDVIEPVIDALAKSEKRS